jgi:hypothetical protein
MLRKIVFATVCAWLATMPAGLARANAKVIHVQGVLAAERVPNPPASEDEAASMCGEADNLPRVLRLAVPPGYVPRSNRCRPEIGTSPDLSRSPAPQ